MSKKLKRFNKKNEILTILLSVSLGFTVFFFTPTELFIRNHNDFIVNPGDIIIPLLICAFAVSVALILLLNLFLLIHEKLHFIITRLLIGLLLAFYVQELFFNGSMSSIIGDTYSIPIWKITVNVLFMYLIMILPLVLSFGAKKYPENKLLNIGKGYAIPYLSAIIFVMQAVGVTSSALQFKPGEYKWVYEEYLSYEPSVSLSEDKNIIVFLVDRLDSLYMDELLEEYPELYDEFEGFTFYQNNVAHFTNTFPSVTNMLTCVPYNGEKWREYFDIAWTNKTFMDDLKKDGYRINLLLDNTNIYNNPSSLEDICDNTASFRRDSVRINYLGKGGVIRTMTRFSLNKLCPLLLKNWIIEGLYKNFSSSFLDLTEDVPEAMPRKKGPESDLKYYNYIVNSNLKTGDQKNFTFLHLSGAHDTSPDLMELYDGPVKPGSFDTLNTTRGDFEILFEYFRQMKELGVYDNSTIIILGDHGRPPLEIDIDGSFGLESAITTALLIKPENSGQEPLQTDNTSEMSNDYLAASILDYAGLDHTDYGYSFNDIIENDIHNVRYYQCMGWKGVGRMTLKARYRITGDARDFNNWEITDSME